jgi:cytochrome b pre-mRNA-processing protein 3
MSTEAPMAFTLKSPFRRRADKPAVQAVYRSIVEQAREPAFYGVTAVPDTPTGRYAMVALHGFLTMDRLGREPQAAAFSQQLFDAMFGDMDRNLREMGVGDLSVGKKIKGLAQYFYAMAAAVREGMKSGGAALDDSLRQFVYQGREPGSDAVATLRAYIIECVAVLAVQDADGIMGGRIAFAPPPKES